MAGPGAPSTPTGYVARPAPGRLGSAGGQVRSTRAAQSSNAEQRAVDDDGLDAEPLPVAANKPRGRYDEVLGVLRGSERPHHLARMSILERDPLNPFSFNEITFAITEFEDLDFPLAVLAIKFECDPVFEPVEIWRAAQRTYSMDWPPRASIRPPR
jgi:hypothetical protein